MTYSGGMRGSPPQALRAWGGWECLSAYGLQGIPILPISVGQEPSRPKGRRKKGRQGTSNEAVRVSAKSQSLLRDFSILESWKLALADEEAAKRRLEAQAARDADAKRLPQSALCRGNIRQAEETRFCISANAARRH